LAGTRKRNFSEHALFCHLECYFDSKIPQINKNPHQDEQIHNQEDVINPCETYQRAWLEFVEPITILFLAKLSFNLNITALAFRNGEKLRKTAAAFQSDMKLIDPAIKKIY